MEITRIHPEVEHTPEYDPLKDVVQLGAHDNMTVSETLRYAHGAGYGEIVLVGTCECGCNELLYNASKMSRERMLYLLEKLKQVILQNPEEDE